MLLLMRWAQLHLRDNYLVEIIIMLVVVVDKAAQLVVQAVWVVEVMEGITLMQLLMVDHKILEVEQVQDIQQHPLIFIQAKTVAQELL
jgi:hypothetical protein